MIGNFWALEASDVWCPNYAMDRSVNTQGGCQALCEAKSELDCVGIVYSHKVGNTDYCYLCTNDMIEYSGNEFGFYRRPGKMGIVFV